MWILFVKNNNLYFNNPFCIFLSVESKNLCWGGDVNHEINSQIYIPDWSCKCAFSIYLPYDLYLKCSDKPGRVVWPTLFEVSLRWGMTSFFGLQNGTKSPTKISKGRFLRHFQHSSFPFFTISTFIISAWNAFSILGWLTYAQISTTPFYYISFIPNYCYVNYF